MTEDKNNKVSSPASSDQKPNFNDTPKKTEEIKNKNQGSQNDPAYGE